MKLIFNSLRVNRWQRGKQRKKVATQSLKLLIWGTAAPHFAAAAAVNSTATAPAPPHLHSLTLTYTYTHYICKSEAHRKCFSPLFCSATHTLCLLFLFSYSTLSSTCCLMLSLFAMAAMQICAKVIANDYCIAQSEITPFGGKAPQEIDCTSSSSGERHFAIQ